MVTPIRAAAAKAATTTHNPASAPSNHACAWMRWSVVICCAAAIRVCRAASRARIASTYGRTCATSACMACAAVTSPRAAAASCGVATWVSQAR